MDNQHIKNLVINLPSGENLGVIDLVLEAGAANGSYQIGCLMYLKELEKQNKVKIDRISGSSIGAISGFYYFTNTLDKFQEDYLLLTKCFKEHLNVCILKEILEKKFEKLSDENIKELNDKLFIVYHEAGQKKQILRKKYENKEDLLNCLLKTSHLPYLVTQNSLCYKEKNKFYVDGGIPHIFENRDNYDKKILYISILGILDLKGMFSVKKEKNNYGRLLTGALDIHNFILYNNSRFCSYVNDWKINDFALLRVKQFIIKIIILVIIYLHIIGSFIYPFIQNTTIYNHLSPLLFNFYRDCLLFYCL